MAEALPEKFEPMHCRACRRLIKPDKSLLARLGKRLTIKSREDCIYRCVCGVAYSNARNEDDRAMITASPELNVPRQVRPGLAEALSRSLNRRSRRAKEMKFCFETSEEAVTWTVFRGLEQQGRLDALVAPYRPEGEPALLLWGAPISGVRSLEIATALAEVCRSLGEPASAFSEPDAVVVWPELTVFVEAKYRGSNERRPNHPGFQRYLDRPELFAASPEQIAAAGYYQLTRNWRIGTALAETLQTTGFLLVNLGPPDKIEAEADAFLSLLATPASREFVSCSWSDVLEAATPLEPWLDRYASERNRLLYWR
ncbi:MAG: hypothetical protein ABSC51_10530 [Gaiellaceae bacterium]|jgi:hypothetical protein